MLYRFASKLQSSNDETNPTQAFMTPYQDYHDAFKKDVNGNSPGAGNQSNEYTKKGTW